MTDKSTTQLFEEILELTDEYDDIFDNYYIPNKFGDLLIYNNKNNRFNTLPMQRCGKENDKTIIGIIVNENKDMSLDVITKNYLTSSKIIIPYSYYNKTQQNMSAYLCEQFNRYCSKYKRISELDLSALNFYIPNIAQLDYINKNINTLSELLVNIWSEKRRDEFINRLYNNGLLSTYKGKYYQWLPSLNNKRQINNFDIYHGYELLPMFTVKINY